MSHQVHMEWHDSVPVIRISGKILDNMEASPLWEALKELPVENKKVVLDMSGVTVMNSAGIGLCLKCFTTARNKGGELVFCGVNDTIGNLFLLTKLNSIFTISADIESALQTLNAQDA